MLLLSGAAILVRRGSTPRPVYLPSLVIVCAVCGASLAMAMRLHLPAHIGHSHIVSATGAHLVLLLVLGSFLLFARFRFADLFLRYGVRILLAGAWAALLAFTAQAEFLSNIAHHASSPEAVHVFVIIVLANALLLSFTMVDARVSRLLARWLFRPPDYRVETRRLAEKLRQLQSEAEITAAVEETARGTLNLSGARMVRFDSLDAAQWPAELADGETVELAYGDRLRGLLPMPTAEFLIPSNSGGGVTHVLLVAPGPARPGLVTDDLSYLRALATQHGNRLDALRRESEAIERQSREAVLQQQVAEAELRALRAQINPHFLFNSLNTIADLVVRDPARAEVMIVRLAGVFRHVLAHSSRPLTSIREEVEFLRTYLYIEEARFGDRLGVEIDVDPEVALEHVPSLILQPLVENALKHGLGPKPGPGNLWISARAQGRQVRITVEDDGMGPGVARSTAVVSGEWPGMGLANVAERLSTLYQDRASVQLEAREGGGSRVTVLIPRGEVGAG